MKILVDARLRQMKRKKLPRSSKIGHDFDVFFVFSLRACLERLNQARTVSAMTGFHKELKHGLRKRMRLWLRKLSSTDQIIRSRWRTYIIKRIQPGSRRSIHIFGFVTEFHVPIRHRAQSDRIQGQSREVLGGIDNMIWPKTRGRLNIGAKILHRGSITVPIFEPILLSHCTCHQTFLLWQWFQMPV
jgi:hypothetical protein